jgi:hypothetical protein
MWIPSANGSMAVTRRNSGCEMRLSDHPSIDATANTRDSAGGVGRLNERSPLRFRLRPNAGIEGLDNI